MPKKRKSGTRRGRAKTEGGDKANSGAGKGQDPDRWVNLSEVIRIGVSYAVVMGVAHYAGIVWALVAAALAIAVNWRLMGRLIHKAFWEQWQIIDKESKEEFPKANGFDWKPLVVLALVAVILTGNNYFGHRPHFRYFAVQLMKKPEDRPYLRGATLRNVSGHRGLQMVYRKRFQKRFGRWSHVLEFGYWAGWRVAGFLLIPMLVVFLLPGERFRDYGLATRGMMEHFWIYVVLFGVVLPAVIVVSFTPAFKYHYPFPWARSGLSGSVPLREFVTWELMYAAQFFSLEFFFRGFMLSALRRSMGAYSIFAMVVPYCMIHFGKPMAETLGAFVAGLILGTLALRTRSIWCGFFIHVSVALSMDIAALFQKGTFPTHW